MVNAGAFGSQLRLSSLEMDLSPCLMHCVLSVVDPLHLRFLRITTPFFADQTTVQRLLDHAPHLNHCHFDCSNISYSHMSVFSFRSHLHLRTLEFSFVPMNQYADRYNWAAAILSSVPNPSPIRHVVLNVGVIPSNEPARSHFIHHLSLLQLVLIAPSVAPLRNVTIRVDSYDGSHFSVGEEQKIRDALPVLRDSGLLEVVLLERN
ncbi:hypothetical protein GGX14DRAFT_399510 [Mycena pura]|uniref:F-box domain-containing protein n=1 Tax=Mycena pura TaxID=153505 RepID=A0AAD6Y8L2_9AGAR|nr:hypothetical protein GGX14DRAFT_399510 [Mycena pura]